MRNLLDLLDHAAASYGAKVFAVEAESSRRLGFADLQAQAERAWPRS